MLAASGPEKRFPNLPIAWRVWKFHWKTAFEGSCCRASGLLQILRLDFRKQDRLLGKKSKQFLRDQSICFHLMHKAISVQ